MSNNSAVAFFSKLCTSQVNLPLLVLDAANEGFGATLVCAKWPRATRIRGLRLTICFQAIMYAASAAVSAFFFAVWQRAAADLKSRVWRRYGWFCALTFFGSVGGLVAAAADVQFRHHFQRVAVSYARDDCGQLLNRTLVHCFNQRISHMVDQMYWCSVNPVPYGIEFLCLCCAKLLVREDFSL
jgi:hypothetical protein